jgi:tetratricopeptide (TPR) repeat protein
MIRARLFGQSFIVLILCAVVGCATTGEKTEGGAKGDDAGASGQAAGPGQTSGSQSSVQGGGVQVKTEMGPNAVDSVKAETPGGGDPHANQKKGRSIKRSADGIDDENALPEKGPALETFKEAANLAGKDAGKARGLFLAAAGKTTYFYAAHFNAGVASERMGNKAQAEKDYRKCLQVRGDYGPCLSNLALLLKARGQSTAAAGVVSKAMAQFPKKAGPHLAAAQLALADGDLKKVEKEARQTMIYDERNVPAMLLMARIFYAQKKYDTARFALKNALVLEPGNALLHLWRGHVLRAMDKPKTALKAYEAAAKLRGDLGEAQENLGVLLLRSGDAEQGLHALKEASRLAPKNAKTWLNLANAQRANKQYKDAQNSYTTALKLDPDLHAVHFNLGLMYMDNDLEGLELLARMKLGATEFSTFSDKAKPTGELKKRLAKLRETLNRRIKREEKRRSRAKERKLIEEGKKKKAAEEKAKRAAEDRAKKAEAAKKAKASKAAPPPEDDK